jgi:DUF1009 family protein
MANPGHKPGPTRADEKADMSRGGEEGPLAIVCGGGILPFVVADAVARRGRQAVLFALREFADDSRVVGYRHHWISFGQVGAFLGLLRKEGCRELVFIGSVVRPALWRLRFDLGALRVLPRVAKAFRGGDNHLLSGLVRILEQDGFHVVGAHEVAPEILVGEGVIGRQQPSERDRSDIERGLALIAAIGAYDVGQAVVVADNRVLAIEAAGGTDEMLAHIAELRQKGRIRSAAGRGVLVKAPKPDQERRVDLPSLGPLTVEGVARAGLAGVAVMAGATVIAEPARVAEAADRAGIFVAGVPAAAGRLVPP